MPTSRGSPTVILPAEKPTGAAEHQLSDRSTARTQDVLRTKRQREPVLDTDNGDSEEQEERLNAPVCACCCSGPFSASGSSARAYTPPFHPHLCRIAHWRLDLPTFLRLLPAPIIPCDARSDTQARRQDRETDADSDQEVAETLVKATFVSANLRGHEAHVLELLHFAVVRAGFVPSRRCGKRPLDQMAMGNAPGDPLPPPRHLREQDNGLARDCRAHCRASRTGRSRHRNPASGRERTQRHHGSTRG